MDGPTVAAYPPAGPYSVASQPALRYKITLRKSPRAGDPRSTRPLGSKRQKVPSAPTSVASFYPQVLRGTVRPHTWAQLRFGDLILQLISTLRPQNLQIDSPGKRLRIVEVWAPAQLCGHSDLLSTTLRRLRSSKIR